MLVGEIRSKGTNLTTNEPEDTMIEKYRIPLKLMKKDKNGSDNELTLYILSVICFRCGRKVYKSNQCNKVDSSNKGNRRY